jgi:uncharacterized membrane protein YidH (DUF202 family)
MPKHSRTHLFMRELKKETIHNFVIMLTTAFGFVAALAWNTFIQAAFTRFFGTQSTVIAMFGYAVAVTIMAVIAITYVSKIEVKEELKK